MSTLSLSQVQVQMLRIVVPIFILIGNSFCLLGLFVFVQTPIRSNPCIMFLIVYFFSNFIYINVTIVSAMLSGYDLDFSTRSLLLCSLRMYISYVCSAIPSSMLVWASMDRMFISSSNVHIRQRSNQRFARRMIFGTSFFWFLFHIHAFFLSEIELIYGTHLSCRTRSGFETTFVSYYSLINAIIPLILMALFGIQTLINIRRAHRNEIRSRDRRVMGVFIVQLSIYICLRLPTSLYLLYSQITQLNVKTSNQLMIEQFVYFLVIFCQFLQVNISPLMNLVTKTFRMELKRTVSKILRLRERRIEQVGSFCRTRNTLTFQMRQMKMGEMTRNNRVEPTQLKVENLQN